MAAPTPRVLIVDDHALLAESLAVALRLRGFEHVDVALHEALDAEAILEQVRRDKPDVVLIDLFLGDGITALPVIPALVDDGRTVLVLTASRDRLMLARCLEAGAAGVFDKAQPFEDLLAWVSDAMLGRATMRPAARDALLAELREHEQQVTELDSLFGRLTDRERTVLRAIMDGETAEAIARRESLSVATVRTHIRSILEKLGVNSQLAAVALARRAGWPPATG